jgi:hypothetical protein
MYISLLVCCLVLLTGLAACEDKEKPLTLSDPHRPDVSVPEKLPEWLEVFRSEMEQGYAVFNASGYGIFNRETVENFFLSEPEDRASWLGVIAFGEEGEPYLYKIRGIEGAYTVSLDATRDPYGNQGIKTYTYEHAGVLPGRSKVSCACCTTAGCRTSTTRRTGSPKKRCRS